MTIWVERTVDVQTWERIQNLFEEHFNGLNGPHEMILVEVDTGHTGIVRLVAGLPDGTPISTYEGFVEIAANCQRQQACSWDTSNASMSFSVGLHAEPPNRRNDASHHHGPSRRYRAARESGR